MQLIRKGEFVANDFPTVEDDQELGDGPVIVSLQRWQNERDALLARNTPLGVRLKSGEHPEVIADDLDRLALVALEFPIYRNGRGYSYSRILRDRYNYQGEIRAVGAVLRDQFYFMVRCGFDALEVRDNITPEIFAESIGEFSHQYQPGLEGQPSVISLRQRLAQAKAS